MVRSTFMTKRGATISPLALCSYDNTYLSYSLSLQLKAPEINFISQRSHVHHTKREMLNWNQTIAHFRVQHTFVP